MHRTLLKSKIHRVTVTEADLEYEGSITVERKPSSVSSPWSARRAAGSAPALAPRPKPNNTSSTPESDGLERCTEGLLHRVSSPTCEPTVPAVEGCMGTGAVDPAVACTLAAAE